MGRIFWQHTPVFLIDILDDGKYSYYMLRRGFVLERPAPLPRFFGSQLSYLALMLTRPWSTPSTATTSERSGMVSNIQRVIRS